MTRKKKPFSIGVEKGLLFVIYLVWITDYSALSAISVCCMVRSPDSAEPEVIAPKVSPTMLPSLSIKMVVGNAVMSESRSPLRVRFGM